MADGVSVVLLRAVALNEQSSCCFTVVVPPLVILPPKTKARSTRIPTYRVRVMRIYATHSTNSGSTNNAKSKNIL